MTLRILIADDEPLARARLRTLVEELGHEVCAEAGDGTGAEHALSRARPDAVLLDIQMPDGDGLTLAQRMETSHPEVPVVLVTAYAEHAVAAFDAAVTDYLLKPVRRERLGKALEKVVSLRSGERKKVPLVRVTVGRKERLVPLDEIDCFVAEDGYVVARSARLEGFVDMRLHEVEERFGDAVLRVHRSCVAVKAAIAGVENRSGADHHVLFHDMLAGIAVSRRQLHEVRRHLRG
jgi:two-component system, LytTR family, response regulator AlgR